MAILRTVDIGLKLTELLGLPPRTRDVTIKFPVLGVVVVECTYYPDKERIHGVLDLLHKNYILLDGSIKFPLEAIERIIEHNPGMNEMNKAKLMGMTEA